VATLLWLTGWSLPRLVPWIAGFLVLTILGERLELARVAALTPRSARQFLVGASAFGLGLVLSATPSMTGSTGVRLAGAGMIALALWGAAHDVADGRHPLVDDDVRDERRPVRAGRLVCCL
jgi:hypothetical protein